MSLQGRGPNATGSFFAHGRTPKNVNPHPVASGNHPLLKGEEFLNSAA